MVAINHLVNTVAEAERRHTRDRAAQQQTDEVAVGT